MKKVVNSNSTVLYEEDIVEYIKEGLQSMMEENGVSLSEATRQAKMYFRYLVEQVAEDLK